MKGLLGISAEKNLGIRKVDALNAGGGESGDMCGRGWSTTERRRNAPTAMPTFRLIILAALTWRPSTRS